MWLFGQRLNWPFRRRPGKHEPVTAVWAVPVFGVTSALRPASHGAFFTRPVEPVARSAAEVAAVVPTRSYGVPVTPGPRVELGFRDGSTAALAPGSEQARALTEVASVLTQRD